MPGLNGRLTALAKKAGKVLNGECQCPGGIDVIRVGKGRGRGYRVNIAPGKPIPPAERCKSCGRERLRVIVRYTKHALPSRR
jgi:hypothetical protein